MLLVFDSCEHVITTVATLARHYAGTMRELESKPRVPAAEAVQQAREEVCGTH